MEFNSQNFEISQFSKLSKLLKTIFLMQVQFLPSSASSLLVAFWVFSWFFGLPRAQKAYLGFLGTDFYMRGLGVSVEVFVLVIAEVWGDSVVAWTRVSCMGFVVPSVSDRLRESPA